MSDSDEILFAYKRDKQRRVLLQDSHRRTLSLPVTSDILFCVGTDGKKTMTVAQVLDSGETLPVLLRFARPECMDFFVDRKPVHASFFGEMFLSKVYDEPYLHCLDINGSGKAAEKPAPLPLYLKGVSFSPVVGVKTAADPVAMLKKFKDKYIQQVQDMDYQGDAFFQELAIVSNGPTYVIDLEPYIDENTFVPIEYKRRPAPLAPDGAPAPPIPQRRPLESSFDRGSADGFYSVPDETDSFEFDHVYHSIAEVEDTKGKTSSRRKVSDKAYQHTPGTAAGRKIEEREPASLPRSDRERDLGGVASGSIPKDNALATDEQPRLADTPYHRPLDMTSAPAPSVPLRLARKQELSKLSVEDVVAKLKLLGLDKFTKMFRKNGIDGVLLSNLTEKMVKEDFSMTHVEWLKLQTFISEGHIPQKTKSKALWHTLSR